MNQDIAASFETLRRIYSEEAYSNLALSETIRQFRGCSPGFVRFAVKGTLRSTYFLDDCIAKLSKNGLRGMKGRTKTLLRLGIFLLRSDSDMPDAVILNEIVSLSKRETHGQSGFVNGLLRSYLRTRAQWVLPKGEDEKSLSIRCSCHPEIVRMALRQYGEEEGCRLISAMNEPCAIGIRVNPLRSDREALLRSLKAEGIDAEPSSECAGGITATSGKITGSGAYRAGLFSLQGIASQVAVACFDPKEGERVLDLCAAPGGKSFAMAERMRNNGSILSCDLHAHRVELIRQGASRLGLDIITPVVQDGTVFREDFEGQFDRVLVDVPCSGLATTPAKPEIKLRYDGKRTKELLLIQRRLLENAYRYVKKGGTLMYSTCTWNKEENEGIVLPFLEAVPEAVSIEINRIFPYNKTGLFYAMIRKA